MTSRTGSLPGRIATVVLLTGALFVATAVLSLAWLTRALDRQAQVQTATQVETARANLLDRARIATLDYTKWDDAYEAMRDGDQDWLLENIGSRALLGEPLQLTVMWGGALEGDLGWADDGVEDPRSGLLPPGTLEAAEESLADAVPGEFDAASFFEWRGEELFVLGVSHFEPVEHAADVPMEERFGGTLVMGIRISEEVVGDIARSLMLAGAGIVREPTPGRPSLALPGLDETPVAYIAWDLPRPGTMLLRRMLPLLLLGALAAAVLVLVNMRLVRRSALDLVAAEQRASVMARTDSLTGLPNRAAFNEALARPARAGERALLFVDLNDFKSVNDSLGHAAGDQIIVSAAERIAEVAGGDALLARIAGDEFMLLLGGAEARDRVRRLAAEIARIFDAPLTVMGHHLKIDAAIGYAVQDADDMPGPELIRQADLAMYESKRHKSGEPVAFRALMEEASQTASQVERSLRTAISSRPDEFFIVYQPVVSLDGAFHHAEVLARWTSPEHGSVPPGQFIEVAEKAGLIIDLGRIVLGQVCRDLQAHPELRISVNVSPLQLAAPDFIPDFVRDLAAVGIEPARIEVELTELVLVNDPVLAARHLQTLQEAGFRIALDDFGTGYSSIGYLEQLRFDTLKIDGAFVSGVRQFPKRQALLGSMIQMAHGLGLEVVCEKVETEEDVEVLRQLRCDLAQGYFFDRPLPLDEFAARWLGAKRAHAAA